MRKPGRLAEQRFEQYQEKLKKEQIQVIDSSVTTEITGTLCKTKGTITVQEKAVERQSCEQRTPEPASDTQFRQLNLMDGKMPVENRWKFLMKKTGIYDKLKDV